MTPDGAKPDGAQPEEAADQQPQAKDPARSFRGVMAGALVMEAIVIALALPVAAKLGGGFASGAGWVVLGLVVALLALCGLLGFSWSPIAGLGLQVVVSLCGLVLGALAVIGVLFLIIWVIMLRLRADVLRRYRQGTLPSQQPGDGQGS
ncbi:DUF4233 domain-containing protein [Sciscionella marina]|uniref:DUF4233 domain-containing protein n=1 Tax=Sciscionella marina TaxID=508770 RepID=UPI0003A04790|nr:DUF4233 domain-containing protein [Sciscionella marina]